MLRLSPTRISLENKDHTWHRNRFDQRKATASSPSRTQDRAGTEHGAWTASSSTSLLGRYNNGTTTSRRLAARYSDEFWQEILADALLPPSDPPLLQCEGSSHLTLESRNSPGGSYHTAHSELHSGSESLERLDSNPHASENFRESSLDTDTGSTIITRHVPPSPSPASGTPPASEKDDGEGLTGAEIEVPTIRQNYSAPYALHPRSSLPGTARSLSREQRRLSRPLSRVVPSDHDGAQDDPDTNRPLLNVETMTFGEVREHRAKFCASPAEEAPELHGYIYSSLVSPSDELPVLPSVERLRGRSSIFTRSPLHISTAAPSSSPDKQSGLFSPCVTSKLTSPQYLLRSPPRRIPNPRYHSTAHEDSPGPESSLRGRSGAEETSPEHVQAERFSPISPSSIRAVSSTHLEGTSTSPPRTPSPEVPAYEVYNDSLPAASQPQTPIGLPRRGIPPMSMAGSYTAPAPRARYGRLGPLRRARAEVEDLESRMVEGHDFVGGIRDVIAHGAQENLPAASGVREA